MWAPIPAMTVPEAVPPAVLEVRVPPLRVMLPVPVADPVRCFALSLYGPHAVGTDLDSNELTMLSRLARFAAAMYAELEAIELRQRITILERKPKTPGQRIR